jgi:hypothetical protein
MTYDAPLDHAQQFEQVIATAFTCRTIIKYNSTLSEEQKEEILSELDTSLQFLQKRLIANANIEGYTPVLPIPPLSPGQLAELLASSAAGDHEDGEAPDVAIPEEKQSLSEPMLQSLYKLYHAYFNTRPGKGLHLLETQYNEAMHIFDSVQAVTNRQQYISRGVDIEQLLYKARGLISAIYHMFREFAVILTGILEGIDVSTETDELTSLQKYTADKMHQYMLRDVTPLMRVYGAHLQLQQRKGSIDNLVNDALAFLIFLEEQLGARLSRQQEIVEQLKAVTELLHDFSSLLTDYEQALSTALAL